MMYFFKDLIVFFAVAGLINCYQKDGKCYKHLNLLFALDTSGSIEPESWKSEITQTKEIIQSLAIPGSGNRFALMEFSTKPNVVLNLDESASKAIAALDALKSNFKDGHSFIDLALNEASALLESAKKTNRLNILVIITDGYMTLKNGKDYKFYLSPAKEKLAAAEAKVYAVGVGKYVNEEALNFMASVPTASHVFKIGNGKSLAEKVLSESEMPCRPMDNEVDSGRASSDTLKCGKVLYERIGCFKDKQVDPRPLPDLILTDRDTTSRVFSGQTINWKNWDTYLPGLVCRCAEETSKKGRKIFGLQFYGECWSSAVTNTFSKDGPAKSEGNCKTLGYKPCGATSKYCVGESKHNFVYRITGILEERSI